MGDRLNMMATLCNNYLCEYPLALQVRAKILELQLKENGSDKHSDVGDTYHRMADVLDNQGKYDAAMELYNQALTIRKKALGEEHADVGATYNNMANVLDDQGKYDAAMELYNQALTIRKKALGEEHADVGATYN